MAGPVRPAYRSREAGKEARDRVAARPPRPSGRWRFHVGAAVIAVAVGSSRRRRVPAPIVDPRVGDLGPALLALEDGTVFPGIAFGAPVAAGGDLVVNTSQTGYQEVCTDPSYAGQVVVMTYPLIGNYGRLRDDDQSHPAVAAGARRRQRHGGRPRGGPPARRAAARRRASRRSPASTRGPSPATCGRTAACAAIVTAPGEVDAAAAVGRGRAVAALGGPGLRRPGLAAGRHRRRRPGDGGPLVAIVDFGLKANIVRSLRRRGARVRVLPHTVAAVGRPRAGHRRPRPLARARRPGPARRPRSRWRGRSSPTAGRCSGSASATRSSARAAGAETRRLRFGHHGANHPVRTSTSGSSR